MTHLFTFMRNNVYSNLITLHIYYFFDLRSVLYNKDKIKYKAYHKIIIYTYMHKCENVLSN